MRELPINDFFAKGGQIREDGRMVHDMYVYEVKKPSESKGGLGLLQAARGDPRGPGLPSAQRKPLPASQEGLAVRIGRASPRPHALTPESVQDAVVKIRMMSLNAVASWGWTQ